MDDGAIPIGKGIAIGLLIGLAVFAIPVALALLIDGLLGLALLVSLGGSAAAAGAVLLGGDPLFIALLRGTIASILCFNLLAFGAAAVISPIAFGIFVIWVISILAIEVGLALTFRERS